MFDKLKEEYLNELKKLLTDDTFFEMISEIFRETKKLNAMVLFPKNIEELVLARLVVSSIKKNIKVNELANKGIIKVDFNDNMFVQFVKISMTGSNKELKFFLEGTKNNDFVGNIIVDSSIFFANYTKEAHNSNTGFNINDSLFMLQMKYMKKMLEDVASYKKEDIKGLTLYYQNMINAMENRVLVLTRTNKKIL